MTSLITEVLFMDSIIYICITFLRSKQSKSMGYIGDRNQFNNKQCALTNHDCSTFRVDSEILSRHNSATSALAKCLLVHLSTWSTLSTT